MTVRAEPCSRARATRALRTTSTPVDPSTGELNATPQPGSVSLAGLRDPVDSTSRSNLADAFLRPGPLQERTYRAALADSLRAKPLRVAPWRDTLGSESLRTQPVGALALRTVSGDPPWGSALAGRPLWWSGVTALAGSAPMYRLLRGRRGAHPCGRTTDTSPPAAIESPLTTFRRQTALAGDRPSEMPPGLTPGAAPLRATTRQSAAGSESSKGDPGGPGL